ncbi:hypothetical protein ACIPYR_16370 [Streptomyces parvus]|uniref:hypothetical protein n=1 Tax=Streptomyces parvus TaxID=66428 RepID=UPI00381B7569
MTRDHRRTPRVYGADRASGCTDTRLARAGVGLRIDTGGFQVKGAAREQLECVAAAGNGRYCDALDADALTSSSGPDG